MNQTVLTLIIVIGIPVAFVLGALIPRLPKLLKGEGKKVAEEAVKVEDDIKKALPTIDKAAEYGVELGNAVSVIVPKQYKAVAEGLPRIALSVVKHIQAISNAGIIAPEQRKTDATTMIKSDLTAAGITIDANIDKLISVVIDAMCLAKSTAFAPAAVSPAQATK